MGHAQDEQMRQDAERDGATDSLTNNAPHNALRHHVTGAIERGEAEAIVEQTLDSRDVPAALVAAVVLPR